MDDSEFHSLCNETDIYEFDSRINLMSTRRLNALLDFFQEGRCGAYGINLPLKIEKIKEMLYTREKCLVCGNSLEKGNPSVFGLTIGHFNLMNQLLVSDESFHKNIYLCPDCYEAGLQKGDIHEQIKKIVLNAITEEY